MPNLCRPIPFRRIGHHGKYGSRLLRQALVKNNLGEGAFRGPLHRLLLMSRSIELTDRRDEFRDEVGLLESGFRILRKEELETAGRLEIQLQRIATHVDETRRLGAFIDALEIGLARAAKRTLGQFRRLKLSDIGQIQQLLLEFEGEPTGSYLVDVFDRVLAHEIESEAGIIDSATTLNAFRVNEKHVETVSWPQLERTFDSGNLRTVARLREAHALEIQQKVLAGLGRVGVVARLPATFEVRIAAYYVDLEGHPVELQVNGFADGAVCWVGRDGPGNQALRLALTERAVDDLQAALRGVGDENVMQAARGAYRLAAESAEFADLLMKGLTLKTVEPKWKPISGGVGDAIKHFGVIAWNHADPGQVWGRGMPTAQAGVLLHLMDRENTEGLSGAITLGLVEPASK